MVEISNISFYIFYFFFQAEDGIRDSPVTGVQTCALPISAVLFLNYSTLRSLSWVKILICKDHTVIDLLGVWEVIPAIVICSSMHGGSSIGNASKIGALV